MTPNTKTIATPSRRDPLSDFLNLLIQRIHPWHKINIEGFSIGYDFLGLDLSIGTVSASVEWDITEPKPRMRHRGNDPSSIAFVQRIQDIIDGKVRDDSGNMVEPHHGNPVPDLSQMGVQIVIET